MNRLCLVASLDDAPTLPGELLDSPSTDFTPLDAPSVPKAARGAAEERQAPLVIDLLTLARFKALMAGQGWRVETARMLFDRVYAHERLSWAHGGTDGSLRRLALDMFRALHAHDGQLSPTSGRH
jgi:hypothetical protein